MKYKSTDEFAAERLVKAASVRSRVCRTGTYFGARPHKLPDGRLAWPDVPMPTKAASVTPIDRASA